MDDFDKDYWYDDYYFKHQDMYCSTPGKLDWNAWGYIIIAIFLLIASGWN